MNSNLFWCIIGIIGGAISSGLISLFFHFKGIKKMRLAYNIETICIISDKVSQINGLKLKYHYNEINNLYSSTITIKNIGNCVIEKQDFAPSSPISLSTNGQFLIDETNKINLFPSNKVNNVYPLFKNDNDNNCNHITITFDYISKKENLTCSLFHTGNIFFNGVLKDGEIISLNENEDQQNPNISTFTSEFIGASLSTILGAIITGLVSLLIYYIIGG